MAISPLQARVVTGFYALTRKSGFLNTRAGKRLFAASYFFYKRHLEDPFAALAADRPELFRGGDILDVGANIGYTASLFAKAADTSARIYAFEPEPFNFALLQTTIRDRGMSDKVLPSQSAVGERSGEIELWINDRHHADHRIATEALRTNHARGTNGYVTVPIVSVDGFLAGQDGGRPVCLIKIDVQGYELSVCRGMEQTVAKHPHLAVTVEYMPTALEDLGYQAPMLLDWFRERDFRVYSLGRAGRLTRDVSAELGEKGYVDLVFSRRELL